MKDDELHPYYRRKAEKNAEMVDYVVTHWRGVLVALLLVGLVSYAFSET